MCELLSGVIATRPSRPPGRKAAWGRERRWRGPRRNRPGQGLRAAGGRRARLAAGARRPVSTSRPTRRYSRGLEVHPGGEQRRHRDLDRPLLRPGRLRLVLPGRRGAAGRRRLLDPASTSGRRPTRSPTTSAASGRYQGNWIPHKLRAPTEGASSSPATRPASACRSRGGDPDRALLRDRPRPRAARGLRGSRSRARRSPRTPPARLPPQGLRGCCVLPAADPPDPAADAAPSSASTAGSRYRPDLQRLPGIAPPDFVGGSADDQEGAGEQQRDADQPLRAERDFVKAE